MRIAILVAVVWSAIFSLANGQTSEFFDSLSDLSKVDRENAGEPSDEYFRSSEILLSKWEGLNPDEKTANSHRMFLVHFKRARFLARNGKIGEAAGELEDEAELQKLFGGRLEFATKSPDSFFPRLLELQAKITAETGSDPLEGKVDYHFERQGAQFVGTRIEPTNEVAGITVSEVGDNQAIATSHIVKLRGNGYIASQAWWRIVPNGKLPGILDMATKEIQFDSAGNKVVSEVGKMSPTERGQRRVPKDVNSIGQKSESAPSGRPPQDNGFKISYSISLAVVAVFICFLILGMIVIKRRGS